MRISAVILLLVVTAATLCAGQSAAPTVFRAYPLGFADPEVLEPALEKLVGPEGSVVMDHSGGRVLIVATEAVHEQLAGVLREVSRAPRNVRIDVRFSGASNSRQSGAGVQIEGGVIEREEGFNRTKIHVQPQVRNESLISTLNVQQSLLVASGREGILRVGEEVPYLDWLIGYGPAGGYAETGISWQQVGSFLAVKPMVIGEGPMLRLTLTPELRGFADGRSHDVRFAGVATELIVRSGQTIQIGAVAQDSSFYSRFLIGGMRGGVAESMDIYLTPHILDPGESGAIPQGF